MFAGVANPLLEDGDMGGPLIVLDAEGDLDMKFESLRS